MQRLASAGAGSCVAVMKIMSVHYEIQHTICYRGEQKYNSSYIQSLKVRNMQFSHWEKDQSNDLVILFYHSMIVEVEELYSCFEYELQNVLSSVSTQNFMRVYNKNAVVNDDLR